MLDLKKIKAYNEVGDAVNDFTTSGIPLLELTDIVESGSETFSASAFYKQLFLENETLLEEAVYESAPTIFSDGEMCFYRNTPYRNEFLATEYTLKCVSRDYFIGYNESARKFIWLTAKAYVSQYDCESPTWDYELPKGDIDAPSWNIMDVRRICDQLMKDSYFVAPSGVFMVDKNGEVLYSNKGMPLCNIAKSVLTEMKERKPKEVTNWKVGGADIKHPKWHEDVYTA